MRRNRHSGRPRTVALAAAAIAALLLAPAAEAKRKKPESHPPQLRGVTLSPNWSVPGPRLLTLPQQLAEIDKACQLGAKLVRQHVSWPAAEPSPGAFNGSYLARVDAAVVRAHACGIKVMMYVTGTPCWATSANLIAPEGCNPRGSAIPPARMGLFQRFTAILLQRNPGLFAYEVWNEPNLRFYWAGTPGQYASLVGEAATARNGTGSKAKILAGALAGGDSRYLEMLYAAGMRGHDGISIHPYSMSSSNPNYFIPPALRAGRRLSSPFARSVRYIRKSMKRHGERKKGIWFSEFGFAAGPSPQSIPQGLQAQWLAKSFRMAAKWPYVHGLTAFIIRDGVSASWHAHFGLLNRDFTPKLSFGVVRKTLKRLRKRDRKLSRQERKARRAPAARKRRARS